MSEDNVVNLPVGQNTEQQSLQQRIDNLVELNRAAGELSYRLRLRQFGVPLVLGYGVTLARLAYVLKLGGLALKDLGDDLQIIDSARDGG